MAPFYRFILIVSLMVSVPIHLLSVLVFDAYFLRKAQQLDDSIERLNREPPASLSRADEAAATDASR